MVVAQYSFSKYGPYDSCSRHEMFMIVKNNTRFVRGLNDCPIINPSRYTGRASYLTNFRLELIYE